MARMITIEFTGGLRLLRAVTWVLASIGRSHVVTIAKTNGQTIRREIRFADKVRVRVHAVRTPGSGPTKLEEV